MIPIITIIFPKLSITYKCTSLISKNSLALFYIPNESLQLVTPIIKSSSITSFFKKFLGITIFFGPARELLPYCLENGLTLIAYSPLGKGDLTRPGNAVLDVLAERSGKTQAQLSLNWLISQENVVAIPKASKLEPLRENVGAVGWRLSKEDFSKLREAFR